jgi:hypothetical protein
MDTNALLSIAFSLVAAFTNIVHIPSREVPIGTSDLNKYLIGSPTSPADVFLFHKNGSSFEVRDGTVRWYCSPRSFFQLQDQHLVPQFMGHGTVDSSNAVEIARRALHQLVRTGVPISNSIPTVKLAGSHEGQEIPFFLLQFPALSPGSRRGADVEIDGRTGEIVFLHLWDETFSDTARAQRINDQVHAPAAFAPRRPKKAAIPHFEAQRPTTNYVESALRNWAKFCSKIGCDPMGETNLSQVDWGRTWVYTNGPIADAFGVPVIQVRLKSGACFESVQGIAFSHFSRNSCYTGDWSQRANAQWSAFRGRVLNNWETLASGFEHTLVPRLVPGTALQPFTPKPMFKPPDIGTEAIKRLVVEWRNWPKNAGRTVWISETKPALRAEFDLENGKLEWVEFESPDLVKALVEGQLKSGEAGRDAKRP